MKKITRIEIANPESSPADVTSGFNRHLALVQCKLYFDELTVVLGPPGEMTPEIEFGYQRYTAKSSK